jgi:hypothetical protein
MDDVTRVRWIKFKRKLCGMFGHKWAYPRSQYSRICPRCGKEQTVMVKEFVNMWEPAARWKDINLDELNF